MASWRQQIGNVEKQAPSVAVGTGVNQTQEGEKSTSPAPSPARNSVASSPDGVKPETREDQLLASIERVDITSSELATIARDTHGLKSRKVALAVAMHPRTPRHIAIPLLRRMFTFDLIQVTLTPRVAIDLKRIAEDQIVLRIEALSVGEKISLARRASARVAAAFLRENDTRVIAAALDNSRLTEVALAAVLAKLDAPQALFDVVSTHPKWSQRREVQIALLRSEKTQLERAQEFAENFSAQVLRDIAPESRIAILIKERH